MYVCALLHVCVSGVCAVVSHRHRKRPTRGVVLFFFKSSHLASQPQHQYVHSSTAATQQQRYNGSRAASSRHRASHGVCVVGAQQQEIERHFHARCNSQTHFIGSHSRHTKHAAGAEENSSPDVYKYEILATCGPDPRIGSRPLKSPGM